MKPRFKVFPSVFKSWEETCEKVAAFVEKVGPERLITVRTPPSPRPSSGIGSLSGLNATRPAGNAADDRLSEFLREATMRAARFSRLIMTVVFCLGAAGADKPDVGKEGVKGTWRYTSASESGTEQPVPDNLRLVISADHWTTSRPHQDAMGGKYVLDESKQPGHIDLMVEMDPERPIVHKGIYEREGDTLRIRFAAAGEARPADFKSNEAKGGTTWVLKRVPDAPKK